MSVDQPRSWALIGWPFTEEWKNMGFNRFAMIIIVRILLILINLWGITFLFGRDDLSYTVIFLFIILAFQIQYLVHFVTQTNRELAKFIDAMRDTDYSTKFPKPQNRSFELLFERFRMTLLDYQSKETKYETQFQFIQYIINNIETGIMALDDKNKVVLSNTKAEEVRKNYFFAGNTKLIDCLFEIQESGVIKSTNKDSTDVELVVFRKEIKLLDKLHTVFTFKDIKSHLESKEIESWQKLIRILAHEIINTLTPITSLAETSLLILKSNGPTKDEDIQVGLDTIKNRSEGLLSFMEDYRKLVKIPSPKKEHIRLFTLISSLTELFKQQLQMVEVNIDVNDQLKVYADKIQLEQMVVNLLTNALQAMDKSKKRLTISANKLEEWLEVSLEDNGMGMDAETLENALIPFYTTKANGSGIGLSFIQQLMHAHDGTLSLESKVGQSTKVTLRFPFSSL